MVTFLIRSLKVFNDPTYESYEIDKVAHSLIDLVLNHHDLHFIRLY